MSGAARPLQPEIAQRSASDPEVSAWVAASAGTGKTKVLTDRVLRLMLAGTDPEKILCITFTKAAAAEMAIRISQTLGGWAVMEDGELSLALADLTGARPDRDTEDRARRLFAQVLDAPGGMKIETIHALCQSLLRRFPLEAGLPPHFDLLDERSAAELLAEARQRILQDPDLFVGPSLAAVAGLVNAETFGELMAALSRERGRLARLRDEHDGVERLVAAVRGHLGLAPDEDREAILAAAAADGAFDRLALTGAAEALLDGSKTDIGRGGAIADWLGASPEVRADGFDTYAAAFLTADGGIRKTLVTKKTDAAYPGTADALQAEGARVLAVIERCNAAAVADATGALLTVGTALVDAYEEEKRRRALLDYDDLILRTAALLKREGIAPWVLFKLDGGIDHILIDEAQDTNPEQWAVVQALSEEFFAGEGAGDMDRTVFVVGDEKQSIFSFQRADPTAFARMRAAFDARIDDAGKALRQVALSISFRSTAAVLDVVDAVFARNEAGDGVAGEPDTAIRHIPYRRGAGGLVELWPPVGPEAVDETEPWSPPIAQGAGDDPAARLARRIADTVHGWISGGEILEAHGRPIHAGDVLVLVRTRNRFFVELVRALKAKGIDIAGVDRMVLTHQLAAMDLIALAEFLLMPDDDLTLATVLKGPLIGLSEDRLFALAHGRGGRLWSALRGNSDLREVADYLSGLLAEVDFLPPYELFSRVLETTCPADPVSGRKAILSRLGDEAVDPLDELLALALAFEIGQPPSLQRFLHWLAAGEAEIKREMEQGQLRRVRIMTVHGAKGLQAPIVILPETMSVPRKSSQILWPDDALPVPLWPPRRAVEDPESRAARQRANQRRDQEYRRLLYVALTRAEDRLYICGHHGVQAPAAGCWYELCRDALEGLAGAERRAVPDWDGEMLRYRIPQTRPVAALEFDAGVVPPALPDWARTPPAPEPEPPRPLAPSRPRDAEPAVRSPFGEEGERFRRGLIIHTLLQTLPDLDDAARRLAAERFLALDSHGLTPDQQAEIADETLAVLQTAEFAPLFAPGSLAEVPVVGLVNAQPVSGQIDRLVVTDDSVLIVDYKSNRPPPDTVEAVPPVYLGQMAAYRAVLREIYPDRPVSAALLWTDGPRLMALPGALLDRWAP